MTINPSEAAFRALAAAELAHRGHRRKVVPGPYLRHLLNVHHWVLAYGFPEYPIGVAALLHDTVEHGFLSIELIESDFGAPVAALVDGVSEADKQRSWRERKTAAVIRLRTVPEDVVTLACADKLDNLLSIQEDLALLGNDAWARLGRSRAEMEWYFRSLAVVFGERSRDHSSPQILADFQNRVKGVFGNGARRKTE